MSCNGTKRSRFDSTVSAASALSTQTQLTDLSGSSPDDNVFNVRRISDQSETISTAKNGSVMPELPSNFKFETRSREKMAATRKGSAQRVSFSIDDDDSLNEEMNGTNGKCGNGGRICDCQHTQPISRTRHYSENNDNILNYICHNQQLHHSVTMPYTQQAVDCECASCFDRKQNIARELLQSNGAEQTYRKSPSVRSLPDIHYNGIHHQYPVSNHSRMSKTPFQTIVTVNETADGKYQHTVYKNPSFHKPSSHTFGTLETIQGGDTPSSTLEYSPLPPKPGVDQSFKSYSDASYELVQSKRSQTLKDSPVSSKQSSESSRYEKCFIRNKVKVLVIINVVLILAIVSAVPVYFSVVVGGPESTPESTDIKVQQQPQQLNKTCVHCSVLDQFDNHEQLGIEKRTDDLCCLKADTNLVEFIIKMRGFLPTYIKAEDEKIYDGRPILQLKSMGLDDRKVNWNPRGLARSGLALKDSHKIEFKTTGYYFVSTELAFKPNSQGILHAEFTAFSNANKDYSKDKPLRSQSETLKYQPNGGRYVSKCNFVDFFSAGSHLFVKLDDVEGLQEEDGQILIFFLGN